MSGSRRLEGAGAGGLPASLEELTALLRNNPQWLTSLRLRQTGCSALLQNESAFIEGRLLRFAQPNLSAMRPAERIARALRSNTCLRELDLRGANMTDEGVSTLSRALLENKALVALDLSNNRIGPSGALALAGLLEACRALEGLNLSHNHIGDTGMQSLSEGVSKSSSIISDRCRSLCRSLGAAGPPPPPSPSLPLRLSLP